MRNKNLILYKRLEKYSINSNQLLWSQHEKMKKFAVFILVLLTWFFPFMPLVHAGDTITEKHCTWMDEESQNTTGHSMNICIELIKKVSSNPVFDVTDFEPIFVVVPFEQYFSVNIQNIFGRYVTNYHSTDPPLKYPPNFIGTIRIIS